METCFTLRKQTTKHSFLPWLSFLVKKVKWTKIAAFRVGVVVRGKKKCSMDFLKKLWQYFLFLRQKLCWLGLKKLSQYFLVNEKKVTHQPLSNFFSLSPTIAAKKPYSGKRRCAYAFGIFILARAKDIV